MPFTDVTVTPASRRRRRPCSWCGGGEAQASSMTTARWPAADRRSAECAMQTSVSRPTRTKQSRPAAATAARMSGWPIRPKIILLNGVVPAGSRPANSGTSGPLRPTSSAVAMRGISRARATRMSHACRCTSGPRSCSGSLSRKYCCTSITIRQQRSRSIRPGFAGSIGSVLRRLRAAQALESGVSGFGVEPAPLGAGSRLGRMARLGRRGGAPDQLGEAFARLLAVALLGAVALRDDDEHAVVGEAPAGEALEPRPHVRRQRARLPQVETQLHRRRQLVDVLAARSGRADKILLDLTLVEADAVGDADHALVLAYDGALGALKFIVVVGHPPPHSIRVKLFVG